MKPYFIHILKQLINESEVVTIPEGNKEKLEACLSKLTKDDGTTEFTDSTLPESCEWCVKPKQITKHKLGREMETCMACIRDLQGVVTKNSNKGKVFTCVGEVFPREK